MNCGISVLSVIFVKKMGKNGHFYIVFYHICIICFVGFLKRKGFYMGFFNAKRNTVLILMYEYGIVLYDLFFKIFDVVVHSFSTFSSSFSGYVIIYF